MCKCNPCKCNPCKCNPCKCKDKKNYSYTKQIYEELKHLKKRLSCQDPIYIYNRDFKYGTYIIDKPGYYVLCEDIVFNPNKYHDHKPIPGQKYYEDPAYHLGFFAAIAITVDEVYLNLDGYSIRQSKEHALQQRFYSNIELASAPFIKSQGPHNFGTLIACAQKIIIANGSLGLSSHHGLHGNNNKKVLLEHLDINDFEIAGIALNGSDGLIVKQVNIGPNRQDVPVLATYSAGRFAVQFGQMVLDKYGYKLSIPDRRKLVSATEQLKDRLQYTYKSVMKKGYTKDKLFRNESRLVDGNVYGLLLHVPGVAVGGLTGKQEGLDFTENVYLDRVCVQGLKVKVNEVIGLSQKDGSGIQNDVAGAVFQIEKVTSDQGQYKANPLADLQLLLAELSYILQVPLGRNSITMDLVNWAKDASPLPDLLALGYKYKCNGDSMFHVNKGMIAYRFDAVKNMTLYKCNLFNVRNYGRLGNEILAGPYEYGHDDQTRKGYHGADTIAMVFCYCSDIKVIKNKLCNMVAKNGDATGIQILNGSKNINICKSLINGVYTGNKDRSKHYKHSKKWLGVNYYGQLVKYTDNLPNSMPDAIGILVDSSSDDNIEIKCVDICNLKAPGKEIDILRD